MKYYTNTQPTEVPGFDPARSVAWKQYGLCNDSAPDRWFADGHTGVGRRHKQEARALCQACPVRARCLAEAIDSDERFGMWGGVDMESQDPERLRKAKLEAALIELLNEAA